MNKSTSQPIPSLETRAENGISNAVLTGLVSEFINAVASAGLVNVVSGHQELSTSAGRVLESTSHSLLKDVSPVMPQEGGSAPVSNTWDCVLKGTKPISLVIGGEMIVFQPTEIPVPPKINPKMEGLIAMWDDQSSLWKNDSPLKIRGISIPIKLWKQIYGVGRCTELWTGSLKQKWHKWKVRKIVINLTIVNIFAVPCIGLLLKGASRVSVAGDTVG